MSNLGKLKKDELIELAKSLELDVKADDNKDEIVKMIKDSGKYDDSESLETQTDFNREKYDRFVFLTCDKLRRTKQVLHEKEQNELNDLKRIVMKYEGKKPIKTNTYKIGAVIVRLVEGVAVPNDVYNLFSDYAKKELFV